jgi:adenine-specific DNA-methyltransferase
MLLNGLGETILGQAVGRARVVDLFSGSGAIAWFAAERTDLPVVAVDLQEYAAVLARAVISRTRAADASKLKSRWLLPARRALVLSRQRKAWEPIGVEKAKSRLTPAAVYRARATCASVRGGLVWTAYGGYYYSPRQAQALDLLLTHLPRTSIDRDLCLAATIMAASRCAAAPGHTAQPFQPTEAGAPYIASAWAKCPFEEASAALGDLAERHAVTRGRAFVGDAVDVAKRLRESDLVVLDPPYSAVQYSRFYHVLETIAKGRVGIVEGAGRYPSQSERPHSKFSLRRQSEEALRSLLRSLASKGCSVVLTFPEGQASNGLSGRRVQELAELYFNVVSAKVSMRFSTLGGNNALRPARQEAHELIVTLCPK